MSVMAFTMRGVHDGIDFESVKFRVKKKFEQATDVFKLGH
jgi:hypothetical protein